MILLLASLAYSAIVLLSLFFLQGGALGLASAGPGMNAQAVLTVSAVVVPLTSFVKWAGLPDKRGPLAVIILSLLGTAFWAWTKGDFARATAFDYFAGFVAVMLSAAGVFGFTRAAPEAVSSFSKPPDTGAGNNPTLKS